MRRRWIGQDDFSWRDLKAIVQGLGPNTALYRARHPKSWDWGANTDFLAAILYSTQSGNWQRGGGKGARPKPIMRPGETPLSRELDTSVPIKKRQTALTDELARRRAMRDRKTTKRRSKMREANSG